MQCAGFGLLAWVGVAGLRCEHGPLPDAAGAMQLRQLFALLLFAAVAWRIRRTRLASADRPPWPAQLRHTARHIYLLMYILVASELLHAVATASTPHTERCLPYLGYVIAAQLLMRTLSAILWPPARGA